MVQPTTKVVAQDEEQPKLSVGREIPHHNDTPWPDPDPASGERTGDRSDGSSRS